MPPLWTGFDSTLFWRIVHWTVGAYAGGLIARLLLGLRAGGILRDWGIGAAGGLIGMGIFFLIPFPVPLVSQIPYEVNIVPFILGAVILLLALKLMARRGGRPATATGSDAAREKMDQALAEIRRRRETR